jgi:glycine cleavage system H protein
MEGFSYNNIFETKGIEYIVILLFFAILIPFWVLLNRRLKSRRSARLEGTINPSSLRIPQGVFFSRNHTWTHLERSGTAKVGLDDLLLHITGRVELSWHASSGEAVKKGDLLAEIGHAGRQLKIYSPISGIIEELNSLLSDEPDRLSEDPFRLGWIYRIKPSDWIRETSGYYLAGEATGWTTRELTRFKDFLMASAGRSGAAQGVILQDGGELRDHTLAAMPESTWQEFQKDFLNIND